MKKALLAGTAITAAALYAQSAQAQLVVSLGGYTEFFGAYYDDDVAAGPAASSSLRPKSSSAPMARPTTACCTAPRSSCRTARAAAAHRGRHRRSVGLPRRHLGPYRTGRLRRRRRYARHLCSAGRHRADRRRRLRLPGRDPGCRRWPASLSAATDGSLVQAPDSGDSTKVMYITPRFAGIQAGVSYATQSDSEAQNVVPLRRPAATRTSGNSAPTTPASSPASPLPRRHRPARRRVRTWAPSAVRRWKTSSLGRPAPRSVMADSRSAAAISTPTTTTPFPALRPRRATALPGMSASATRPVRCDRPHLCRCRRLQGRPDVGDWPAVHLRLVLQDLWRRRRLYDRSRPDVQADVMYVDEDLRNVDALGGVTATASNEGYRGGLQHPPRLLIRLTTVPDGSDDGAAFGCRAIFHVLPFVKRLAALFPDYSTVTLFASCSADRRPCP